MRSKMHYRRLTIDVVMWGDDSLTGPGMFMEVVKGLINALPFTTVQNIRNEPIDPKLNDKGER